MYPLPGAATVTWDVLAPKGWAATLEVDARFHLMAVQGERALGVWRDELGVESIRVYAVAPKLREPAARGTP